MKLAAIGHVWGTSFAAEAAALTRSVLLAWMIGPEELGRALVLGLVLRLAEMVSDIGIERLLANSDHGDDADFLKCLHGLCILKGIAGAAIILVLAWPVSALLPGGATYLSHATLALVPAIRGFLHLSYKQAERHGQYRKMAMVENGALLVMIISTGIGGYLFADHRAMIVALLFHGAAQCLLSHAFASSHYHVRFDRPVLRQSLNFGGPLVINAILMFVTFQADRLIVASFFGWQEVAIYGVTMQLAMLPAQITGRVAASMLAPKLRAANAGARDALIASSLRHHLLMAACFAFGFMVAAPDFIATVYGAALEPGHELALAFALAAGARIIRTPLSQRAVSLGQTSEPARANLWRAAALFPASAAAALDLPLSVIAMTAALGEAAATVVALRRAGFTHKPARRCPT